MLLGLGKKVPVGKIGGKIKCMITVRRALGLQGGQRPDRLLRSRRAPTAGPPARAPARQPPSEQRPSRASAADASDSINPMRTTADSPCGAGLSHRNTTAASPDDTGAGPV